MEIAKKKEFFSLACWSLCTTKLACLFVALLQVCLWLCSGRGEIGCATVITNLAKVWGKQTEQEKAGMIKR